MIRSKEIILLLVLLVGAMGFVLWYVIDRRAKNRAAPPVATRTLAPEPLPAVAQQTAGQTPAGPQAGTGSAVTPEPKTGSASAPSSTEALQPQ